MNASRCLGRNLSGRRSLACAFLSLFWAGRGENGVFWGLRAKKVAESLAGTNISCTFAPLFDSVVGK